MPADIPGRGLIRYLTDNLIKPILFEFQDYLGIGVADICQPGICRYLQTQESLPKPGPDGMDAKIQKVDVK